MDFSLGFGRNRQTRTAIARRVLLMFTPFCFSRSHTIRPDSDFAPPHQHPTLDTTLRMWQGLDSVSARSSRRSRFLCVGTQRAVKLCARQRPAVLAHFSSERLIVAQNASYQEARMFLVSGLCSLCHWQSVFPQSPIFVP